jgi:hypothetical protein
MTDQLNLLDPVEAAFIESFYGLSAISTDPFFLVDPKNFNLNTKRTAASAAKTTLRAFPGTTYTFFTSSTTVTTFAEYTVAAIETSNRIKANL